MKEDLASQTSIKAHNSARTTYLSIAIAYLSCGSIGRAHQTSGFGIPHRNAERCSTVSYNGLLSCLVYCALQLCVCVCVCVCVCHGCGAPFGGCSSSTAAACAGSCGSQAMRPILLLRLSLLRFLDSAFPENPCRHE